MNIQLAILFGSRAKGQSGKLSDTDVAVLADHELELNEKGKLAEEFGKRLGVSEDKVDIVDLRAASPLLQHEVAISGKLLEGEPFDFLRFKVLAWKRYQDTAKLRRWTEMKLKKIYNV